MHGNLPGWWGMPISCPSYDPFKARSFCSWGNKCSSSPLELTFCNLQCGSVIPITYRSMYFLHVLVILKRLLGFVIIPAITWHNCSKDTIYVPYLFYANRLTSVITYLDFKHHEEHVWTSASGRYKHRRNRLTKSVISEFNLWGGTKPWPT